MASLHNGFAWVVVVANAAVGLWALAAHWLPMLRHRALWVATGAAQVSVFVQVALGVAAQSSGSVTPEEFHVFYGFVALIAVGIVYSYQKSYRRQLEPYRHLLYGGTGLFLMGLALRSMQFGGAA